MNVRNYQVKKKTKNKKLRWSVYGVACWQKWNQEGTGRRENNMAR